MNLNNLFLLVLLCLTLVLPGCMEDPECPYAGSSGDGKFQMTLSIGNMEEIETRSVATDAERSIKNLMVLVFDKTTGKYSDGEVVAPENLQGTDGAQQRTVTVNLAPAVGDKVVILANYYSGITTIPLTKGTSTLLDINKLYSYTGIISGKIVQPMSGEFTYSASGAATCQLTRSMCKIQLNASKAIVSAKLIDNWQVYNVLSALEGGALYSESPISCTVKSGLTNSSFVHDVTPRAVSESCYVPEYPCATKAKVTTVSDTQLHKDRTCLIITISGNEFYRIDLFDHKTGKFIDMRRNTHITITINKLDSYGYATVEEALAAPAGNLEYDIKVDGENDHVVIANGSYALTLSNSTTYIYTDETEFDLEICKARYILPAELTSLPAGITNKVVFTDPDRDNSEFTILTQKINSTDTPINVRVKRKSQSPSASIKICLGSLEKEVSVQILPAAKLDANFTATFSGAKKITYRWSKVAEGMTVDANETILTFYTGAPILRWVRLYEDGESDESREEDMLAVPVYVNRSAELEACLDMGSEFVFAKLLINVRPGPMYVGWFGGEPLDWGEEDSVGWVLNMRYSKRLFVDTEDEQKVLPWGPLGFVGGIAQDKEQGEAITKLLGAKGSSYAAAYYCYMKNDTNKNGRIDVDEPIVWYLPAQNQLMAVWAVHNTFATKFTASQYWCASEYNEVQRSWYTSFGNGATGSNPNNIYYQVRCVKDGNGFIG